MKTTFTGRPVSHHSKYPNCTYFATQKWICCVPCWGSTNKSCQCTNFGSTSLNNEIAILDDGPGLLWGCQWQDILPAMKATAAHGISQSYYHLYFETNIAITCKKLDWILQQQVKENPVIKLQFAKKTCFLAADTGSEEFPSLTEHISSKIALCVCSLPHTLTWVGEASLRLQAGMALSLQHGPAAQQLKTLWTAQSVRPSHLQRMLNICCGCVQRQGYWPAHGLWMVNYGRQVPQRNMPSQRAARIYLTIICCMECFTFKTQITLRSQEKETKAARRHIPE